MDKNTKQRKSGGNGKRKKSKRRRITPKGVLKIPTVLLVEDVPVSKKLCEAALKRANFSVVCADNGLKAVEMFKTHQKSLELVLMDVNIPGMDGLEATAKIRDIQQVAHSQEGGEASALAVIVGLTGNTDPENVNLYRKCGMDGCINKGRILIDALRAVNQQLVDDPGSFVDLCASGVGRSPRTLGGLIAPKQFMPTLTSLAPGVSRVLRSEASSVQSSEDEGCTADIENDDDNGVAQRKGVESPTQQTRQPIRINSGQAAPRYMADPGQERELLQQVLMQSFDGEFDSITPVLSSGNGSGSEPTSLDMKLQERKPFSFDDMLMREEKGHGSIANAGPRPRRDRDITRNLGKMALQAQLQAKLQAQIDQENRERRDMSDESTPGSPSSTSPGQSPQLGIRSLGDVVGGGALLPRPGNTPRSLGLSPRERKKLRTKRIATTDQSNPDVLLVEDVKVSQKIYLAALRRGYHRVAFAETGEKAVELYKRHHSSLKAVLMDIFLPGVDGIQTTRHIRRYEEQNGFSHKPILAHSATSPQIGEVLRHYKACGMNGYIQKGSLICETLARALQAVEEDPDCFFCPEAGEKI